MQSSPARRKVAEKPTWLAIAAPPATSGCRAHPGSGMIDGPLEALFSPVQIDRPKAQPGGVGQAAAKSIYQLCQIDLIDAARR